MRRDVQYEVLTLLEWYRLFVYESAQNKQHPAPVLVGVRFNSVYNEEFFFQDLLVHKAFQTLQDLLHPRHT